ncbi:MAG: hypothetical protein ABI741_01390 [Ferruginibacter sp.]
MKNRIQTRMTQITGTINDLILRTTSSVFLSSAQKNIRSFRTLVVKTGTNDRNPLLSLTCDRYGSPKHCYHHS